MTKTYTTRGFLYHAPTASILLKMTVRDKNESFVMIQDQGNIGDDPEKNFCATLKKYLKHPVHTKNIRPVYDYEHATSGTYYIYYADVSDSEKPDLFEQNGMKWIPLAAISKRNLSAQTHHDIIIGERVIRADTASKNQDVSVKAA